MKTLAFLFLASAVLANAQSTGPQAAVVPEAFGYDQIPGAALPPTKSSAPRAIFDATHPAGAPTELLPALNMAGAELNGLTSVGAPASAAKFVVVFHGPAVDGILDDEHYKAKFGVPNPNLKPIAEMKKRGVQFYVCGQYLLGSKTDPKLLTPDVTLAADSLVVLMHYQNEGYALMSF